MLPRNRYSVLALVGTVDVKLSGYGRLRAQHRNMRSLKSQNHCATERCKCFVGLELPVEIPVEVEQALVSESDGLGWVSGVTTQCVNQRVSVRPAAIEPATICGWCRIG